MNSCLAAAFVVLVSTACVHGADWRPVGTHNATAKVYQALDQTTTMEFIETPLVDVLDFLKELHGIEIQIDQKALADTGVGTDSPITKNLKGMTLASGLRLMLRDVDLTYIVSDDVLIITSPAASDRMLITHVYDVEPLINAEHRIDELAKAVTDALGGRLKMPPADAQKLDGKPKKEDPTSVAHGVAVYRNFMIVTDSDAGHKQVQRLLGLIGAGLQTRPENGIR